MTKPPRPGPGAPRNPEDFTMDPSDSRRGPRRSRIAALALAAGLSGGLPGALASGAPAGAPLDLRGASLTDLPGPPSAAPFTQPLGLGAMALRDGAVVLDSPVLLKVYFTAYARQPVDGSAILTPNTQMIDPPAAVRPSSGQMRQLDAMVAFAASHPRVLIAVDDIALDAYVPSGKYYPIDNRLFIHGAGYYFDNSPYHYVFQHPRPFRHLHCRDAATLRALDQAIGDFRHFRMVISCTVLGADAATHALRLRVDQVRLLDADGRVLIRQLAHEARGQRTGRGG